MKRILAIITAVLLLFAFSSCLGSTPPETECTGDHVDADENGRCDICDAALETEKEPEEDKEKENGELALIKDGEALFQIVVAKDSSSSTFQKAAKSIQSALEKLDVEVKVVTENADNATACEVILGAPTTRGDVYKYDVHTLGYEGYSIRIVEGKVLLLGGSDEAFLNAVDLFIEDYLGIDKKTEEIDTVVLKTTQSFEQKQDDYRITALKLDGVDMHGYTIAVNLQSTSAYAVAKSVQTLLYTKAGYWMDIVPLDEADKSIVINLKENTYEGDGFYVKVNDGQLLLECEFSNKIEEAVADYMATRVSVKQGAVNFTAKTHNTSVNVRDIYYSDFGAVSGDGKCDFEAFRACHEYANQWGHSVKAEKNAVYYFGKGMGSKAIWIRTDTDWNGCRFIIDDGIIDPRVDPEYQHALFIISTDKAAETVPITNFMHVTKDNPWIDEGDNVTTNIGWAPGEACMLSITSYEKKQFIRYGPNEDTGNWQREIILVDAEGNIDPSTPLQWSYTQVDTVYKYSINERPITVGNVIVETYFNNAPSEYTYYARNIKINRSNATVENVTWEITHARGDTGAPYNGLISAEFCHNATVRNYTYEKPPQFYTETATASNVVMGTYGLSATNVNQIIWDGINQTDIRDDMGVPHTKGATGSNYCKNMILKNSKMSLFDAHKGTYNATLMDSEVVSLNMIGEGRLLLDNVRLIGGDEGYSIGLRQDYGATWQGSVEIVDCVVEVTTANNYNLFKSGSYPVNWDFGYTCYFPQVVIIDNLKFEDMYGNVRTDVTLTYTNFLAVHKTQDISLPENQGGVKNPYMPTKEIIIRNCPGLKLKLHNTPMFKDTKLFIDDVEITDWRTRYA